MGKLLKFAIFPKRSKVCKQCGEKIIQNVAHSTLEEKIPESIRKDFCAACYKEHEAVKDKEFYWQSVPKVSEEVDKTDDEQLVLLFREKYEEKKEKAKQLVYLLLLYLIRKKVFLKKKGEKGTISAVYAKTNELFVVEECVVFDDIALQQELFQNIFGKKV